MYTCDVDSFPLFLPPPPQPSPLPFFAVPKIPFLHLKGRAPRDDGYVMGGGGVGGTQTTYVS